MSSSTPFDLPELAQMVAENLNIGDYGSAETETLFARADLDGIARVKKGSCRYIRSFVGNGREAPYIMGMTHCWPEGLRAAAMFVSGVCSASNAWSFHCAGNELYVMVFIAWLRLKGVIIDMEKFDVLATVTDIMGRRTLVYTGSKGDTMVKLAWKGHSRPTVSCL